MPQQEIAGYQENVFLTVIVPRKQNVTIIIALTPVKSLHPVVKMLNA